MPFNKLKIYNQLLDLIGLGERERIVSLKGVFNRDFEENTPTFFQPLEKMEKSQWKHFLDILQQK